MEEKAEREVDINLVPAQGLVPPKLRIRDIDISDILVTKLNEKDTLTQNKYSWLREGTATNQNNKPQVNQIKNTFNQDSHIWFRTFRRVIL